MSSCGRPRDGEGRRRRDHGQYLYYDVPASELASVDTGRERVETNAQYCDDGDAYYSRALLGTDVDSGAKAATIFNAQRAIAGKVKELEALTASVNLADVDVSDPTVGSTLPKDIPGEGYQDVLS